VAIASKADRMEDLQTRNDTSWWFFLTDNPHTAKAKSVKSFLITLFDDEVN
jgi:hypothetical protein